MGDAFISSLVTFTGEATLFLSALASLSALLCFLGDRRLLTAEEAFLGVAVRSLVDLKLLVIEPLLAAFLSGLLAFTSASWSAAPIEFS